MNKKTAILFAARFRLGHAREPGAGVFRVPGMVRDVLRVTRKAYGMDR